VRKVLLFCFLFSCIAGLLFGQRPPDVLVDRNGRTITADMLSRERVIIATIFLEGEILINLEYYNGTVIAVVVFISDHFTDIDSLEMAITADRSFTFYRETYNSIGIKAGRGDFVDRASVPSRPPFGIVKEYRDGRYISRFEIIMPNYKFDVVKYANEFVVNLSIEGRQYLFSAGPAELRATQDAGLIMSFAGLM